MANVNSNCLDQNGHPETVEQIYVLLEYFLELERSNLLEIEHDDGTSYK